MVDIILSCKRDWFLAAVVLLVLLTHTGVDAGRNRQHRQRDTSRNRHRNTNPQDLPQTQPEIISTSTNETAIEPLELPKCHLAQARCMQSFGCSVAIHNYLIYCSTVINGDIDECTYRCRLALISLLSTEDDTGKTFMTCDCEGHEFCVLQRSRLEVCQAEVMENLQYVLDETTPLSCTLAEMVCAADTSCVHALNYYNEYCRKLMKGEKCTSRCNNSLSILYRQPKSFKLRNCVCDGREDYDCPSLRYNTETMCFGLNRRRPPTTTPSQSLVIGGDTSNTHHHNTDHHNHHHNHTHPNNRDHNHQGHNDPYGGGRREHGVVDTNPDNVLKSSDNSNTGDNTENVYDFDETNKSAQTADKNQLVGLDSGNSAVNRTANVCLAVVLGLCLSVLSALS